MIITIGEPSKFALESYINVFTKRRSQMALGYFNIILAGRGFGVRKWDASMLGASFETVVDRLANRGKHISFLPESFDAKEFILAYQKGYFGNGDREIFFGGISAADIADHTIENKLCWAPDGDECFDDGSYVFHIDVGNKCRLIAHTTHSSIDLGENDIVDISVEQDYFYSVLQEWSDTFYRDWENASNKS